MDDYDMIIEAGRFYFWGSGRYLKFPKSKLLPKNTFTSAWVFLLEEGKISILNWPQAASSLLLLQRGFNFNFMALVMAA